jgi:hypothetical protein
MSLKSEAVHAFEEAEQKHQDKLRRDKHERVSTIRKRALDRYDDLFGSYAPQRELVDDRAGKDADGFVTSVLVRAEGLLFRYRWDGSLTLIDRGVAAGDVERESVALNSLETLGRALKGREDGSWGGWKEAG